MMRTPSGCSRSLRSSTGVLLPLVFPTTRWLPAGEGGSDREQLLFFVRQHPVDVADVLRGDAVQILLGTLQLVGADVAILLQRLEVLARGAALIADGDPAILRLRVGDLDQLLAPLLGQRREGEADEGPVVAG